MPDLAPALRLYAVLDWLILRAIGAVLLLLAWGLHDRRADVGPLEPLLYGQDVARAIVAYGVLGAICLVPVIVPRAIASPRTLLAGAVKAGLLVGLALVLLPVIDVAVRADLPAPLPEAVRETLPGAVEGLCAVMILATIVLAFFQQVAAPPLRRDGLGNPVRPVAADDLRALRASRM